MRIFALVSLIVFATALPAFAQAADPKTVRTWKAKCASCHGADGKGTTAQGTKMGVGDMTSKTWQKTFTDDQIKDVILKGINRTKDGKTQKMDAYKGKIPDDQVKALVTYIRAFAK